MGLSAAIGIATTVMLILFLTTRELAGTSNSGSLVRLTRYLNVSVVPLMMAFAVVVAATVAQIFLLE